ncbi:conserved hypothetical protein EF_0831/AHA_3912 [Pilibacter termitis]|uniref:Cytoplasmic protein n=1 Tax=Pilibacter termitis TaxID=263852 RepID=A0A1T4NY44_9ENTE|nr:DUF4312 family protein [Pilibacter termitis]SJZ83992.1 conserved hypothetical protein EF_0831/AHA_3912 [Pilibacter termitis]
MSEVKRFKEKITVQGEGENKKAAFASALNKIQSKVLKESEDVILKIEPIDINILSAEKQVVHEKFLFFFFPRERVSYSVSLEIEVEITRFDAESVQYKEVSKAADDSIKIPLINKRV